jgi:hypothetical protein
MSDEFRSPSGMVLAIVENSRRLPRTPAQARHAPRRTPGATRIITTARERVPNQASACKFETATTLRPAALSQTFDRRGPTDARKRPRTGGGREPICRSARLRAWTIG